MKIDRSLALLPVAVLAVGVLTACEPADTSSAPSPTKTVTSSPAPKSSSPDDILADIQASNSAGQQDLKDKIAEASKSAKAEASKIVEASKVPNVVGMTNAEAIPALHAAGFMANEEDATGQDRWAIDNSNWKVCRQDPGPGNHPATLRVAIYSVKLDESC
jgi:hypothetical protein